VPVGTGQKALFAAETAMAYILRSLAVIGVIALNSPVHGGRSDTEQTVATARSAVRTVTHTPHHEVGSSLTAAREAAQIIAGLDPETRQRLLEMAAGAARGGLTGQNAATR